MIGVRRVLGWKRDNMAYECTSTAPYKREDDIFHCSVDVAIIQVGGWGILLLG